MTDHRRFLDLVAASIDFELTPAEHELVAGHMATCRTCRREADGFRRDAAAIAAYPPARLAPDVAAAVLERVLRRPSRNRVVGRLVLAALIALFAVAAATVGAALIREWRDGLLVVPPPLPSRDTAIASDGPSPEPTPSQAPSPSSASAPTWTVSTAAGVDLTLEQPKAVAVGPDLMVALGGLGCTVGSDGGGGCWAKTARSVDGTAWTEIPSSDATEVGGPVTEGPQTGMHDIAGGADGFVAIGYAAVGGGGGIRATVWYTADGTEWDRIADVPAFDNARPSSVARTARGWIIGGAVFEPDGPRAAVWSSADGRAWERVPDGPGMAIGGGLPGNTDPLAGGIRDLAVRGDTVVAVGSSCDAQGTGCIPAAWTSMDDRTWDREPDVPDTPGDLILVASIDSGFLAVRRDCSSTPCSTAILRSPDGTAWREVSTDGFPERAEPRAVATVEGTIALAAVEDGRLKVLASVDGASWSTVREVTWKTSEGASPKPDLVNVYGLGMATRPDGSATIVGWTSIQDDQAVSTDETFQFEVKRP